MQKKLIVSLRKWEKMVYFLALLVRVKVVMENLLFRMENWLI
jgi:hypothetical protein